MGLKPCFSTIQISYQIHRSSFLRLSAQVCTGGCRYTIGAARACFLEGDVGSLSTGKMADFVVLSPHSWDEFAAQGSASVVATYVGGVRAFP